LLLEIRETGIQVVFKMFTAYFHLRMHRKRLSAGLCTPRDP